MTAKTCVTGSAARGRSTRRRRYQQVGNLERETGINALGAQGSRLGTQNQRRNAPAIGSTRLPSVPPRFEIKVYRRAAALAFLPISREPQAEAHAWGSIR